MLPFQRKKVDMSLMTEEEKKLFRLYGKLPTNKPVMKATAKKSDRQYFDSGDYAMSKAGVTPQSALGTAIPSPENIPHSSPNPAKAPSTDPLSISPPGTSIVIPAPQHSPPAQSSPMTDNVIVADELEGASESLPKATDAMDITKPASPNRLSKLSPFSSVPLVSPPMDTTPQHASHMRDSVSANPEKLDEAVPHLITPTSNAFTKFNSHHRYFAEMPSTRASDASLKRKRSTTSRSPVKRTPSRSSRATASTGDFDDADTDLEMDESPTKRSLARSRASGSRTIVETTPTKPKQQLLFVSSTDPRLRQRATPRKPTASPTKGSRALPSLKGKERAVETPTRTRIRKDVDDDDEDEIRLGRSVARSGGSKARHLERYRDKVPEDSDEESADDLAQAPEGTQDEDADEVDEGAEDISDGSSAEDFRSPTKSSPSKSKSRKRPPNESALHVPGFVTQTSFDAYFQQISIPARTSSNAFTTLLPTLSMDELFELLENSESRNKHKDELQRLRDSHVAQFDTYLLELEEGFNLLFYGFGSKRLVLNQFARESCSLRGNVVVLNAYKPSITIKDLLNRIERLCVGLNENLPLPSTSKHLGLSSLDVQAHRIYHYYRLSTHTAARSKPPPPLFIIIHNIESPSMRISKAKAVLALLASHPRIHLAGSIDHMNSPLMWSTSEALGRGHPSESDEEQAPTAIPSGRNFTWLWHDLTTFEHYDHELASQGRDLTSIVVSGSGKVKAGEFGVAAGMGPASVAGPLTEVGAQQVLSSVTDRSRKVFMLLAKKQLTNADSEAVGSGANVTAGQMGAFATPYDTLFNAAREAFLATSDQALRGLLQEFRDHGMVVSGTSGGTEVIWIPLSRNVLERISDTP